MASAQADPASFRDPAATVFRRGDRVFRALSKEALADWEALERAPFFAAAMAAGEVVPTERVDEPAPVPGAAAVVEHQAIPFLSYPYEWTFAMLRDAALLHLDLLLRSLDAGFTMKDGTAYNVQLRGAAPTFVDIGSFTADSGGPWPGYRQFCETMLYPLMLVAHRGVPFQPLLRGRLEGIEPATMRSLLGVAANAKQGVLKHVLLQTVAEQRFSGAGARDVARDLERAGFSSELTKATVRGLRKLVDKLRWKQSDSAWSSYRQTCSYSDADREAKDAFVTRALAASHHRLVWDLGCNDGAYSRLARAHADYVVAVDSDPVVVDVLYRRLRDEGTDRILPLVLDLADPSPGLGWRNRERPAFVDRGRPDLILALALVHHLVITANVPLASVLDWFAGFGARLVVEFVEPHDPMAARMLANKPAGRHDDYTAAEFRRLLAERFEIDDEQGLPSGCRTLYHVRPRG